MLRAYLYLSLSVITVAQLAFPQTWGKLYNPLRIRQALRTRQAENLQVYTGGLSEAAPAAANEDDSVNFTVKDCEAERDSCKAAQQAAPRKSFTIGANREAAQEPEAEPEPDPTPEQPPQQEVIALDAEFDLLCDVI
ncbi:hypothetical protein AJ79_00752 [Helicocarpus griseus UAMH5409]|uniref:Uncharacterized protein n=1 Tax=Helicocarpus griseus UAMH5409 TaxID=1447875 RepID=A0A2B7Y217_9EURO|nr:hypothetical protein AJ79_00752 [Helicocarpus griseus UAMH5409]